jgi:hypothetical protein
MTGLHTWRLVFLALLVAFAALAALLIRGRD